MTGPEIPTDKELERARLVRRVEKYTRAYGPDSVAAAGAQHDLEEFDAAQARGAS